MSARARLAPKLVLVGGNSRDKEGCARSHHYVAYVDVGAAQRRGVLIHFAFDSIVITYDHGLLNVLVRTTAYPFASATILLTLFFSVPLVSAVLCFPSLHLFI